MTNEIRSRFIPTVYPLLLSLIFNVACSVHHDDCTVSCSSNQKKPTAKIHCTITGTSLCYVDLTQFLNDTEMASEWKVSFLCQSKQNIFFRDSGLRFSKNMKRSWPDVNLLFRGPCKVSLEHLAPLTKVTKLKSIFMDEGTSLTESDVTANISRGYQHMQKFQLRNTEPTIIGVPKMFTAFKWNGMRSLSLSNLKIRHLPQNLDYFLPNLVRLELARNSMTKPPLGFPWIAHYDDQVSVSLSYNRIRSMPDYKFKWVSREINLEGNELNLIGEDVFQQSPYLKNINLGRNKLAGLPLNIFRNLRNLRNLYLESNSLSQLHNDTFKDLENLEYLNLNGNWLTTIPMGLFLNLRSLRVLYLNNNRITNIESCSLPRNANYLTDIHLKYNKLKIIPQQVFRSGFVGLRGPVVDLSYNSISSSVFNAALNFLFFDLPKATLSEIRKYEKLGRNISPVLINLEGNNISKLYWPEKGFDGFKHSMLELFQFDLSFNPLSCDCTAFFFALELNMTLNGTHQDHHWQFSRKRINANWKCTFPASLRGYRILEIPGTEFQCTNVGIDYCPLPCECSKRAIDAMVTVNCIGKNINKMPERMPSSSKLALLMQNNSIASVEPRVYLKRMLTLRLSFNKIHKIETEVFHDIRNETELYLDNNLLQNLPKRIRDVKFSRLSLSNNLLPCNCNSTWIKVWVEQSNTIIIDAEQIHCASGLATGYPMLLVPDERFVCQEESFNVTKPLKPIIIRKDISITQIAAYIVSGLLLMILVISVLIFRYRREIKLLLFAHLHLHPFDRVDDNDLRENKIYDAFVSYSKHDERWVNDVLKQRLEDNEPPYNLCIHYRDFTVGMPIQENILKSVRESRRTILVLSRNFIQSEWCMLEFRAAHHKVLQNRAIYLIIIQLDDVNINELDDELQLYMRTNTYLSVNDRWFWRKLFYSLPQLARA